MPTLKSAAAPRSMILKVRESAQVLHQKTRGYVVYKLN